jgi:hypothetical protein
MLTLKAVNKAIAARGIKAELVQGNGYLWFFGADVEYAQTTSVSVCRLNHLTLERWMSELDSFVADSKKVENDLAERVYNRIKPQ